MNGDEGFMRYNYNNHSDDKADTYLLDVVGGNENGA